MKKNLNLPSAGTFLGLSPQARRWIGIVFALIVAATGAVMKSNNRYPSRSTTGGTAAGEVAGHYRAIDGDSFMVGRTEVRLAGVDAPEGRQLCHKDGRDWTCGREAESRLSALIGGREVRCAVEKIDQHGRSLAVCRVGDVEINRWMVARGFAVAYGGYEAEERDARQNRRGIWEGEFERPRDWRDRNHNAGP